MEVQCAEKIWISSAEELYKLANITMLYDDDSKALDPISEANKSDEKIVAREVCVNHMAKRIVTGLNKCESKMKSKHHIFWEVDHLSCSIICSKSVFNEGQILGFAM